MSDKLYTINDFPKFSKWPETLLFPDTDRKRLKNKVELNREYEIEKWGPLLKKLQAIDGKLTIEKADEIYIEYQNECMYFNGKDFVVKNKEKVYKEYFNFIENNLSKYTYSSNTICELGSGYGSVIIKLSKSDKFTSHNKYAYEYTDSGLRAIELISKEEGINITTGKCDFFNQEITSIPIPTRSIIFTVSATACIPTLSQAFIDNIIESKAEIVIHFEPCYEHCNETMHGLLLKKYIEVNDYNRNLVTLLKQNVQDGKIKIVEEIPMAFGVNPLFCLSVVVLKKK
jgi:hypothetical protein